MPAPPLVNDRYALRQQLGVGSFKAVWLAQDTLLERDVALAFLVRKDAFTPQGFAALRAEAQLLAGLKHRNIVTVFDLCLEEDPPYLVMEYVGGSNLHVWIHSLVGSPPIERSLVLLAQVADALEAVHAKGLFHRDVKPSNVLIDTDGTPKLGDFGLAEPMGRARVGAQGAIVGTVRYMSPEQCKGLPADAPADMYAFGVSLFEAVTGRCPFEGEDVSILVQQQEAIPPPPSRYLPDCPPQIQQLILRLLDKSPDARPDAKQTALTLRGAHAALSFVGPLTRSAAPSQETYPRAYAAVVMTDMAGFSRLTGRDDEATQDELNWCLECIRVNVEQARGRVLRIAGDSVFARFDEDSDALDGALAFQSAINLRNADRSSASRFLFRVGINSGHVIEDRGEIWNENVNVAARLQEFAEPGGICISAVVLRAIGKRANLSFEDAGLQQFKNIADPVHAYRVRWGRSRRAEAVNPLRGGVAENAAPRRRSGLRPAWSIGLAVSVATLFGIWLSLPHSMLEAMLVPDPAPVAVAAACAVDKHWSYQVEEGPVPQWLAEAVRDGVDVIEAALRNANPRLFAHLTATRERQAAGLPSRQLTYVWGPPAVGKSFVARWIGPPQDSKRCLIKLSEHPWTEEKVDLPGFNKLPTARQFELDALLGVNGCIRDDALVPFAVVDDLDEVHPELASRILRALDDLFLNDGHRHVRSLHVVVFGRPEAFSDWYRDPDRRGHEAAAFLRAFELRGPTYANTGALEIISRDRCTYLGVDCTKQRVMAYVEHPRRHPFLTYSLRSLPIAVSLVDRVVTEPNESEQMLKESLFQLLLRNAYDKHGRPGPDQPRYAEYKALLERVAVRYANSARIGPDGFFSVADADVVTAADGTSLSVRTLLSRSGIAVLEPRTKAAATRFRFEPPWVLAHLIESRNLRSVPGHSYRPCYP